MKTDQAKITIAIPLYHGKNWIPVIANNIRHIPKNAKIVLSDEVSSDDSASLIARKFANDPKIQVRLREGEPGWRQHCNALMAECDTPFFSLLPQDDSIGPRYYQRLLRAFAKKPEIGISFGQIVGTRSSSEPPIWFRPPPKIPLEEAPWKVAIELDKQWNLGIPFRGVIRRELLTQFDTSLPESFSDQIWVFSMALRRHITEVPDCVYLKRYHPTNTHTVWPKLTHEERYKQLLTQIRQVLDGKDQQEAERYLTTQCQAQQAA